MGNHYTPEVHKAVFETENQVTYICTIKNFDEMEDKIKISCGRGSWSNRTMWCFWKGKSR